MKKMKNLKKSALILLICVICVLSAAFSSCATIVTKKAYPVSISSSPSNAHISVTDNKGNVVHSGISPSVVRLKAGDGYFNKAGYSVTLSSAGYQSVSTPVEFKIDGWYFGNVFLGGLIGMAIVDPLTGAMWKTKTKNINVTLHPSSAADVSNVRTIVTEEQLIILYDLSSRANIEVHASFDGGVTFQGPLRDVIGAVGNNIAAENDKVVVWNVVKELGNVDYPNAVIKIVATGAN